MENVLEVIEVIGQVNLDKSFLTSELKNQIKSHPTYETTYNYIVNLPERTLFETIYMRAYKKELDRLENNEAHQLAKLQKEADKRGMTIEEYLNRPKTNKVEYRFKPEEYLVCKEQLQLAKSIKDVDQQVYWMEVADEKIRYDRNEASKRSKAKKK